MRHIKVFFDGSTGLICVEDDGVGICRDSLALLGQRHATSKIHTISDLEAGPGTLGFRGEALSSLSDIALVEVLTRARGSASTYSKILKGGATLSLGLSSQHRSPGTTVTVRDVFYNQPVRRRLLATSLQRDVQSIKERVLRLALMHPAVAFSVTDLARNQEVLLLEARRSLLSTLEDAFGKAFAGSLKEVAYAKAKLRLEGVLSKACEGQASKAVQQLYINRLFVRKTPVHKLIISHFEGSARLKQRAEDYAHGLSPSKANKRDAGGLTGAIKVAHPAFVLNLSCPLSQYDITFEASKTYVEFKDWAPVLAFVREVLCDTWGAPSALAAEPLEQPDLPAGSSKHAGEGRTPDCPPARAAAFSARQADTAKRAREQWPSFSTQLEASEPLDEFSSRQPRRWQPPLQAGRAKAQCERGGHYSGSGPGRGDAGGLVRDRGQIAQDFDGAWDRHGSTIRDKDLFADHRQQSRGPLRGEDMSASNAFFSGFDPPSLKRKRPYICSSPPVRGHREAQAEPLDSNDDSFHSEKGANVAEASATLCDAVEDVPRRRSEAALQASSSGDVDLEVQERSAVDEMGEWAADYGTTRECSSAPHPLDAFSFLSKQEADLRVRRSLYTTSQAHLDMDEQVPEDEGYPVPVPLYSDSNGSLGVLAPSSPEASSREREEAADLPFNWEAPRNRSPSYELDCGLQSTHRNWSSSALGKRPASPDALGASCTSIWGDDVHEYPPRAAGNASLLGARGEDRACADVLESQLYQRTPSPDALGASGISMWGDRVHKLPCRAAGNATFNRARGLDFADADVPDSHIQLASYSSARRRKNHDSAALVEGNELSLYKYRSCGKAGPAGRLPLSKPGPKLASIGSSMSTRRFEVELPCIRTKEILRSSQHDARATVREALPGDRQPFTESQLLLPGGRDEGQVLQVDAGKRGRMPASAEDCLGDVSNGKQLALLHVDDGWKPREAKGKAGGVVFGAHVLKVVEMSCSAGRPQETATAEAEEDADAESGSQAGGGAAPVADRGKRAQSAPPFFQGSRRTGAHGNPLSSLATICGGAPVVAHELPASKQGMQASGHVPTPEADQGLERRAAEDGTELGRGSLPRPEMEPSRTRLPEQAPANLGLVEEQRQPGRTPLDLLAAAAAGQLVQVVSPGQDMEVEEVGDSTPAASGTLLSVGPPDDGAARDAPISKWRQGGASTKCAPDAGHCGDEHESVASMYQAWQNPCMPSGEALGDATVGVLGGAGAPGSCMRGLVPGTLSKHTLKKARVLRQVDSKFIAAVAGDVVLLIDQHAADERVRLEELRAEVLHSAAAKRKAAPLDQPVELTLRTYGSRIETWGWRFRLSAHRALPSSRAGGRSTSRTLVLLTAVPSVLDTTLSPADLMEYLRQLIDTEGSSAPPPSVIRLLNSKACRGAIMFGDALHKSECQLLVEQLKLTQMCFQVKLQSMACRGVQQVYFELKLVWLEQKQLSSNEAVQEFEP
eukprot:jgi/Mesen1/9765/ME000007S09832